MKNFSRRLASCLEQAVSALFAFWGVPRLTPEQKAHIAEMERDYEQQFGLKSKGNEDCATSP